MREREREMWKEWRKGGRREEGRREEGGLTEEQHLKLCSELVCYYSAFFNCYLAVCLLTGMGSIITNFHKNPASDDHAFLIKCHLTGLNWFPILFDHTVH